MRLLLLLLLSGCALSPAYHQRQSTAELCRALMTLPSYNVGHPLRLAELERRGHSCGSPADIAAAQRSADQVYMQNLQTIQSMQPPPPRQPIRCHSDRFGNTTCY